MTKYICKDCGKIVFNEENIFITHDGETVCRECFEEDYYTCEECGNVFHCDDIIYFEDCYYCADCSPAMDDEECLPTYQEQKELLEKSGYYLSEYGGNSFVPYAIAYATFTLGGERTNKNAVTLYYSFDSSGKAGLVVNMERTNENGEIISNKLRGEN